MRWRSCLGGLGGPVGILVCSLSLGLACSTATRSNPVQLANPASVHCGKVGGELRIETLGNRGQIGVCDFEDGRQCEEWALFRGECPIGGRKVTGLVTDGARYCVIRGGQYKMTQGETDHVPEQGNCTLPDGKVCDTAVLWQGSCG